MKLLKRLPIKSKMLALLMITSSVALLIAVGGFVAHELLIQHSEFEKHVRTQARILAANLGTAMVFEAVSYTHL
ncbi:MAG: hypothetical protein N3G20_00285, partial [Verrucomicrobiae bacterium]|nr:hypothetical protein [Verrucomicrobiae bacterium]